jgi:hypothetical protein
MILEKIFRIKKKEKKDNLKAPIKSGLFLFREDLFALSTQQSAQHS